MAPEQIRGSAVDRRADVFALGVVLFEAATGVPLFTASSDYETMRRVMESEVPDPGTVRAGFPAELSGVIRRAVALEPADRFATVLELAGAVQEIATRERWIATTTELTELVRQHAPPGDRPWRRAVPMTTTPWSDRTTGRWRDG